ncbi:Carboxylesterase [Bacillus sp. NRRL B-14911]|nr:Carboxylesterase [Bacillus sp. NRRL B-14911]
MEHIFRKGANPDKPTLLLLHGTGGNERDLIPLSVIIDEEASVLSVRGNVLENGMPRFFRRLSEGVFDEEDLVFRTSELNEFLDEAAAKYEFDRF